MQGARHGLNRPALYPEWSVIYDMDDADFHLPHLAKPVTEAMGQIAWVLAGSRYIADWARASGAPGASVLWTGTEPSALPPPDPATRPPVVAWAQTQPWNYHREARFVADVMAKVAARRPGTTLRLYDRQKGSPASFLSEFRAPGLTLEWRSRSPYATYLNSFEDVAVGLAPLCPETPFSRGKSFGKVLAYLDRKVAVVASDAGEHGAFFSPRTGVVTNEPEAWVAAITGLLNDPSQRAALSGAATQAFHDRLSLRATAARLAGILQDVRAQRAA